MVTRCSHTLRGKSTLKIQSANADATSTTLVEICTQCAKVIRTLNVDEAKAFRRSPNKMMCAGMTK